MEFWQVPVVGSLGVVVVFLMEVEGASLIERSLLVFALAKPGQLQGLVLEAD